MKWLMTIGILLSTLWISTAAEGQVTPEDMQKLQGRGRRALHIGNVSFYDSWKPILTAGSLAQISLKRAEVGYKLIGDSTIVDGEIVFTVIDSLPTVTPPRWYAHFLLTTGMKVTDDGIDASGFSQIGLLRRTGSGIGRFWGLAAQYVESPRALGPVARIEIMDNVGLQVGWLWNTEDSGEGIYASIDYFGRLFEDLKIPDPTKGLRGAN
jgi:hypothetical protein